MHHLFNTLNRTVSISTKKTVFLYLRKFETGCFEGMKGQQKNMQYIHSLLIDQDFGLVENITP